MTKVVVGFDGSDAARSALWWAAGEASQQNATLRIVHIVAPSIASDGFGYVVPVELEVFESILKTARAAVEKAADEVRAEFPQLTIECDVRSGSSSGELIEESEHASLVVVGSRGLGGFRGLLLGSVSNQLATHSVAPTVVLRDGSRPHTGPVVVGVDGSDVSNEALAYAFEFASMHGLELVAVHAWEVPAVDLMAVPVSTFEAMHAFEGAEARAAAEALAGYGDKFPDVTVTEKVLRGSPVGALLDTGKDASLIVVGSRGHGEFVGAVLGSVSQAVLHRAKVPVAVVPHRSARLEKS